MNVRTRLNFEKEKKPDLDPYVAIDVDEVPPPPSKKNHVLSVLTKLFGNFTDTRKSFIMPNPMESTVFLLPGSTYPQKVVCSRKKNLSS